MKTTTNILSLIILFWFANATAQESVTKTLYFDSDQSNLKVDINEWFETVDVNLVTSATIVGHTDSIGSNVYNMNLGMKRAKAVKQELSGKMHGIEIKLATEGESQPVSEKSNAENRRVELTLQMILPKEEKAEPIIIVDEPQEITAEVSSNQVFSASWGMQSIEAKLPEDAKPPIQGECGVHFSGLLMGGVFDPMWITQIYVDDVYSEYVGEGNYPSCMEALPEACRSTFDGITVDPGTRLIIYSKPDFKGDVLLDVTGPAIINNQFHKATVEQKVMGDFADADLQKQFPQEVRTWSESNMNMWQSGSVKISCGGN